MVKKQIFSQVVRVVLDLSQVVRVVLGIFLQYVVDQSEVAVTATTTTGVGGGCQMGTVGAVVVRGPGGPVRTAGGDGFGSVGVAIGAVGARVGNLRMPVVVDLPKSAVN